MTSHESRATSHAIIYDFDDLMYNSGPLHEAATQQAFAQFGIEYASDEDMRTTFYGRRIPEVTDIIFEYVQADIDKDEFTRCRDEIFLTMVEDSLEPMRGLDTVIALTKRLGLRRAIASSGMLAYITAALERFGLAGFFETIVTGEHVANGKPHPDLFLTAAERLQVKPKACVVLEDSTAGVEAAKRASMRVIGVCNPHALLPQDLSKADIIVEHLGEISEEMILV